jgi:hypothetical protein
MPEGESLMDHCVIRTRYRTRATQAPGTTGELTGCGVDCNHRGQTGTQRNGRGSVAPASSTATSSENEDV